MSVDLGRLLKKYQGIDPDSKDSILKEYGLSKSDAELISDGTPEEMRKEAEIISGYRSLIIEKYAPSAPLASEGIADNIFSGGTPLENWWRERNFLEHERNMN